MSRRLGFLVFCAVSLLGAVLPDMSRAQANHRSAAKSTAISSVSIIDGISLGMRKSSEDGYTVSVDANGARPTVLVRSQERTVTVAVPETRGGFEIEIEKTITPLEIVASFE